MGSGNPDDMSGIGDLFKDPEILAAMQASSIFLVLTLLFLV